MATSGNIIITHGLCDYAAGTQRADSYLSGLGSLLRAYLKIENPKIDVTPNQLIEHLTDWIYRITGYDGVGVMYIDDEKYDQAISQGMSEDEVWPYMASDYTYHIDACQEKGIYVLKGFYIGNWLPKMDDNDQYMPLEITIDNAHEACQCETVEQIQEFLEKTIDINPADYENVKIDTDQDQIQNAKGPKYPRGATIFDRVIYDAHFEDKLQELRFIYITKSPNYGTVPKGCVGVCKKDAVYADKVSSMTVGNMMTAGGIDSAWGVEWEVWTWDEFCKNTTYLSVNSF